MALTDFFLIAGVIFAIVIAFPPIWSTMATIIPALKSSSIDNNPTTDSALSSSQALINRMDIVVLMVVVGFGLAIIISSFFIESHPAFFFVSLILGAIAMSITPVFANTYNSYIVGFNNANWNASTNLPITTFIMQHFPEYLTGVIFFTFIMLFAKLRRGAD